MEATRWQSGKRCRSCAPAYLLQPTPLVPVFGFDRHVIVGAGMALATNGATGWLKGLIGGGTG